MKATFFSPFLYKFLAALLVTTLALGTLPVMPVYAASITVTTTADEYDAAPGNGLCSLREAIANANNDLQTRVDCLAGAGADTITLVSGSTYTLSLVGGTITTGDLDITDVDGLTIQASGITPATIDANDIDRVIDVPAAAGNLTLNYITITNGNAVGGSTGGGINFASTTGTLTVNNSTISSNIATNAAGCGGGIFNTTTAIINITNSSIEGNQCAAVGSDGGGLWKGTGGTLTISNSTFYNNSTDDDGGGARITNGTATISFSTFSNNSTSNVAGAIGGAIQISGGTVTIIDSILANSTANAGQNDCDQSGTPTITLIDTLIENDTDCGIESFNSDPVLGAFQNNGGATSTMAITNASPAFNAATSCGTFTTDQRGYPRPQKSTDNCDLGAFELQVNDEPSFTTGGNVTVLEDSGAYSAAWASAINDGDSELTQTLTFNVSNDNNTMFASQPAIDSSGVLTFTPAANANGTAMISVYLADDGGTANGGDDTSPTEIFTITVTAVNDIPTFTAGSNVTVNEDSGAYSAGWATSISDGDPETMQTLTFNVTGNTNVGLFSVVPTIDATTGDLTFTPAANANGSATITITLSDNGGTANGGMNTTTPQTFVINVTAVDDAPVALNDSVTVAEDAAATMINVLANDTDVDGGPKAINSVIQPVNGAVVITNAGANLTYQPNANYCNGGVPTDDFTYTLNGGSIATVVVTVTCVNDAPLNSAPASQTLAMNTTLVFTAGNSNLISVSDVDAGAGTLQVTLTATNGIITLSSTTGLSFVTGDGTGDTTMTFTGTLNDINNALNGLTFDPTTNYVGSASLQIVTDDQGFTGIGGSQTDSDVVDLTIYGNTPTITSPLPPAGTVGVAYSHTFTATGSPAPTFSLTGSLPAGLSFDGVDTISGTPTSGGVFGGLIVTATNGVVPDDTQNFSITINAPTIILAPASLPNATLTVAYNQTITASGGTSPHTFALTAGTLPGGLAITSAGVLSGTPTAAGTFNFTVTATDSSTGTGPYTGSRAYSITVNNNTMVTIDQAVGQADPTNNSPINFTVVFNEAVTGFATGDVSFSGSTVGGTLIGTVTEIAPNDGTTYNVAVTGMTSNGIVVAMIPAGVATGAVTTNDVSTSTDNIVTYDSVNPTVVSTDLTANYTGTGPGSFIATFSKAVDDPAGNTGTDDVTNTANYLLVNKGTNGVANTVSCAGGVVTDDTQVTVTSVIYNNSSFTATVMLASPLPVGSYRLFICGTTSIVDLAGNPLNGGTDYTFDFVVQATQQQGGGGTGAGGANLQNSLIPATGFPQNKVTTLPIQPADKAYASTDLWLEIPKLGVKMSIVGVPKTNGTWDVTWLNKDAGWLASSAFPTWSGNSVLTGHVWDALNKPGPFARLKTLKYGDQVKIHAFSMVYTYEITESVLITNTDAKIAFKHNDKSVITLITCEDYKELSNTYSYRRMVRAVLVSVVLEK